ncbi:MAG: EAL domain-containing protein [Rhodocyclaceae bacterium]|nr:EAL domain-containing protein [Rhodocyclaceae bacterium]MBX3669035.1 EAL domain-containing protein [Rhodocyclaceae bacterium]
MANQSDRVATASSADISDGGIASRLRRGWFSLRLRIIAACLLAMVLMGAAGFMVSVALLADQYRKQLDAERSRFEAVVARDITNFAVVGEFDRVGDVLQRYAGTQDLLALRYIDIRGGRVEAHPASIAANRPDWFADWLGLRRDATRHELDYGRHAYGVLEFEFSPLRLENHLWRMARILLGMTFAGLVVLGLVVRFILKQGLKPLFRVARATRQLSTGNYQARVELRSEPVPELQGLIENFNTMADAVAAQRTALARREAWLSRFAQIITSDVWRAAKIRALLEMASQHLDLPVACLMVRAPDGWRFEHAVPADHDLFALAPDWANPLALYAAPKGMIWSTDAPDLPEDNPAPFAAYVAVLFHTDDGGTHMIVLCADAPRPAEFDKDELGMVRLASDWLRSALNAERQASLLAQEKELADVTLASIGDAVLTTDGAGRVSYLNSAAEKLTGWQLVRAVGRELAHIMPIADAATGAAQSNSFSDALERSGVTGRQVWQLTRHDGSVGFIDECVAPIRDALNKVVGVVVVFHDVTESHQQASKLSWEASHDPLTGLINRAEFERRLQRLVRDADLQQRTHSLMFMDLDRFKHVNDSCGHLAGDHLLRQVTQRLQGRVRSDDSLARVGGDEFALLLHFCEPQEAALVAQAMIDTVRSFEFAWGESRHRIGVSIGITAVPPGLPDSAHLVAQADTACYVAKANGRNRYYVHQASEAAMTPQQAELRWMAEIDEALADERILLYEQPVVPLGSDAAAGASAVEFFPRLEDSDGRAIAPSQFIAAAERAGRMPALDRWVLARACAQIASQPARYAWGSVNVSQFSLADPNFAEDAWQIIANSGMDARRLCFEIAESAALGNLPAAERLARALRARGCYIAVDGFGGGLSAFSSFKQMPLDLIKLDSQLVRDAHDDPVARAQIAATALAARRLQIATVAVGVEFAEDVAMLRELGMDHAQGYALGRPQHILAAMVRDHSRRGVQKTED